MENLLSFPKPFPDETLYSLAVRYHRAMSNSSYRSTSNELFGCYSRTCGSILPCGLEMLASRLQGVYTLDSLIQENTLLPIYLPLTSAHNYSAALKCVAYGTGQGLKLRLGLTSSGFLKHSGFRYCKSCVAADYLEFGAAYWHRVHMLPGVCACPIHAEWLITQRFGQVDDWRHMLLPAEDTGVALSDSKNIEPAVEVARLLQWGLAHPELAKQLIERDFLKFCLSEQGLMKKGRLCEQAIIKNVMGLLENCLPIAEFSELVRSSWWVVRVLRPRGKTIQPFCFYFCLWLIKQSVDLIGLFLNSGQTYAFDSPGQSRISNYQPSAHILNTRRLAYTNSSNPRCHDRVGYFWLYRYDRKWLLENLGHLECDDRNLSRVDWCQRDAKFSDEIIRARDEILATVGRPIKVTGSSLARLIKNGFMLLRCISKLPRSALLLKRIVESEHDFQLRKLRWAVRSLAYPQSLQRGLVVRLAGIRVRRFYEAELVEIIRATKSLLPSDPLNTRSNR